MLEVLLCAIEMKCWLLGNVERLNLQLIEFNFTGILALQLPAAESHNCSNLNYSLIDFTLIVHPDADAAADS